MRAYHFSFLLSVAMCFTSFAFGQSVFTEELNESDMVIEGRVIEKYSSWNADSTTINTFNIVKISQVLKGDQSLNELIIRTEGGKVGNIYFKSAHQKDFSIQKQFIFFIREDKTVGQSGHYELVNTECPFLEFNPSKKMVYSNPNSSIGFNSVRDAISAITLEEFSRVNEIRTRSEVCLSIDNIIPNIPDQSVSFDIKIKSNYQGFLLSEVLLQISYPTENLGSNLVDSGLVEISKLITITDPSYQLFYSDVNDSTLGIAVLNDCELPLDANITL